MHGVAPSPQPSPSRGEGVSVIGEREHVAEIGVFGGSGFYSLLENPGERVLNLNRATQSFDIFGRIGPLDSVEALIIRSLRNLLPCGFNPAPLCFHSPNRGNRTRAA